MNNAYNGWYYYTHVANNPEKLLQRNLKCQEYYWKNKDKKQAYDVERWKKIKSDPELRKKRLESLRKYRESRMDHERLKKVHELRKVRGLSKNERYKLKADVEKAHYTLDHDVKKKPFVPFVFPDASFIIRLD